MSKAEKNLKEFDKAFKKVVKNSPKWKKAPSDWVSEDKVAGVMPGWEDERNRKGKIFTR